MFLTSRLRVVALRMLCDINITSEQSVIIDYDRNEKALACKLRIGRIFIARMSSP
jgi:hypothetical protein